MKRSQATSKFQRIIHLPTAVGGNAPNLSRQMNKMGISSTSLVSHERYFKYGGDTILSDSNTNPLLFELRKLKALTYIFSYDIVFFNFGQTLYSPEVAQATGPIVKSCVRALRNGFYRLMQKFELRILELRRCTLLIQYQGDDARQGDILREHYSHSHVDEVETSYYTPQSDEHKRKQIGLIAPKCHRVYALNPDLLKVLPTGAEFLPYAHIDLDDWAPSYQPRLNGVVRVGHAPTHRAVKGTKYVLQAVEVLQSQGWPIELVLVEGLTNADARKVYESIDVLVDQLLVGWYGGLAVELMALGKPVIAYIRDADLTHVPREMAQELPIVQATTDTLANQIVGLVQMPNAEWELLQRRGRSYVEKWHNPEVIARRILTDLEEP